MGFRFSKRITLLPGVRMNISGSGFGLSVGPRGASVSINRNGIFGNASLPGTGLLYRTKLSGGGSRSGSRSSGPASNVTVTLTEEGTLIFRDETGAELAPVHSKLFKSENASQIQQMLENSASSMNEGLGACLYIHKRTTPLGASIPLPAEFDGSYKPRPAQPLKVGLFDRLLGKTQRIEAHNQERQQAYQTALAEWKTEYVEYSESRAHILHAMTLVGSNDVKAMEVVADYLLNRITWPRVTNIGFGISECGRVVGIDLDLPDEDEVPSISASVGRDRLSIKKRTDAQMRRDFVTLAYGSVFRVAGELFAGLPTIKKVVISSYVQRQCQGTAQQKDEYVMSSIIDRDGWEQIDFNELDAIDPAAAIGMFELRVKTDRTARLQEITPFDMT